MANLRKRFKSPELFLFLSGLVQYFLYNCENTGGEIKAGLGAIYVETHKTSNNPQNSSLQILNPNCYQRKLSV